MTCRTRPWPIRKSVARVPGFPLPSLHRRNPPAGAQTTEGYARLTAASVPAGIVDGTYVIDERSIGQFRLGDTALCALLQSLKEPLHA